MAAYGLPKIPPILMAVIGLGVAAALSGGASGGTDTDTWRVMRYMTPGPSANAAQGEVSGTISSTPVLASMQEIVATGHANGFRVYVPKAGLAKSPKVRVQQGKLVSGADKAEWTLFLAPDANLPAFTERPATLPLPSFPGGTPTSAPPIVSPGAPLPSPGSANLPSGTIPANFPSPTPSTSDSGWPSRPDFWPASSPWPPPGFTPPKPGDPRPTWLPPFFEWPLPGMATSPGSPSPTAPGEPTASTAPPVQFPPFTFPPGMSPLPPGTSISEAETAANPPPGAQLFVQPVSDAAEQLGGVAAIRGMAAQQQDPALSKWLTASANVAYQRQRNLASVEGGTKYPVRQNDIPSNVVSFYGGSLSQLSAKNPGKDYTSNNDWNVGTVWKLPIEWDAESKALPPRPGGSANVTASRKKKKPGKPPQAPVLTTAPDVTHPVIAGDGYERMT